MYMNEIYIQPILRYKSLDPVILLVRKVTISACSLSHCLLLGFGYI